jgi:hypothetical protein
MGTDSAKVLGTATAIGIHEIKGHTTSTHLLLGARAASPQKPIVTINKNSSVPAPAPDDQNSP